MKESHNSLVESVVHVNDPSIPSIQRGGVGAGLATSTWWEKYYTQQHDTYWDWYLPNQFVMDVLQKEARLQLHIREPSSTAETEEDDEGTSSELSHFSSAASIPHSTILPWISSDSAAALHRFASLPVLQLGCGSSEVSALLWESGWRSVHNIDFSPACIIHMKELQKQHGWITDPAVAQSASATAAAAAAAASSSSSHTTEAIAAIVSAGFVFSEADVRDLSRYPNECFSLIFDKGTLDCVSLESEGDPRAAGIQMLREVWRCLRPGGVSICFSLYPPYARALFWAEALPADAGGESAEELMELAEVLSADNPPTIIRNLHPWSELRMHALDLPPLELPSQKHTYLYVAIKR
jgi:SAM-dependent methyltransferase